LDTKSVAIIDGAALPAEDIGQDLDRAADYARAEKAPATRKAYWSDFALFGLWCQDRGLSVLPASAESVAAYLASEASRGVKPSTIGRRCAAIRYVHGIGGHPSPTLDERVKAVVRGIRRTHGAAPTRVTPATADRVIAMAPRPDGTITALRDRTLLLLGFAGALRRSELVALNVADVEEVPEGLRVTIRRGKTDQEGRGAVIAIVPGEVACPVAALRAWLEAAEITEGPLFRPIRRGGHVQANRLTDRSVANIVKAHAKRVGLDPVLFSGHSLRAGFLTSAAKRGASLFKMMATSRHRSTDTLAGYVRDQELFKDHAGSGLL
jgi:site-specific recombinase XerD